MVFNLKIGFNPMDPRRLQSGKSAETDLGSSARTWRFETGRQR